ncbi:hypothetical protein A5747_13665 [Mycobacterium sp. IS-836]|nr:hypothetical protein [Mycobacterium sp. IS-836]OMC55431.1 hypothetical protein A5747_13665 [Mycobacterium sp. IS-836]
MVYVEGISHAAHHTGFVALDYGGLGFFPSASAKVIRVAADLASALRNRYFGCANPVDNFSYQVLVVPYADVLPRRAFPLPVPPIPLANIDACAAIALGIPADYRVFVVAFAVRRTRPSCHTAPRVFGAVDKLKVIDIDTTPHTAEMVDRQAVWYRAVFAFPGVPVGISVFAVKAKLAIAVPIVGAQVD